MLADVLLHWPYLAKLSHDTASSLTLDYTKDQQYVVEKDLHHGAFFMTNHRDIVMDSAWLSYLVERKYGIRPFIGIGNNLFGKKWIEPFVRLNRAFVVIRDGSPRELLQRSKTLSEYIHHLRAEHKSIWLAQREGRAKDGNDRTQGAVLKMLTLGGENFLDAIYQLNICPVSLSYEFDPCDYLKAAEFQLKRDNPAWHKSTKDDLTSMSTGIKGHKGRVAYDTAPCINQWIDDYADLPAGQFYEAVASRIDREIHRRYHLFPGNYVALDLLEGTRVNADHYTSADEERFSAYLAAQLAKIDIPDKDETFLRERILTMYANPVRNQRAAIEG